MANHSRSAARLASLLTASLLLAGCGQKGGLVRPEAATAAAGSGSASVVDGTGAAIASARFEAARGLRPSPPAVASGAAMASMRFEAAAVIFP